MSKESRDEFDAVSGVGGRYLAPKRLLDYAISFLTLTIISAAVAGGSLVGLSAWDARAIFSDSTIEQPTVPQLPIAIVDGTNSGLSVGLRDKLLEDGWNIVSALSLTELDPSLPTSPTTLIFITEEANRSVADQLLKNFPDAAIVVSSQFSEEITVLVGTDFFD